MRWILGWLATILTVSLANAQLNCPAGYEVRMVKCNGQFVEKCVPQNLSCSMCWTVEYPPCPGRKSGGSSSHSSYDKALAAVEAPGSNWKSGECLWYDNRTYAIYLNETDYCTSAGGTSAAVADLKKRLEILKDRYDELIRKYRAYRPGAMFKEYESNLNQSIENVEQLKQYLNNITDANLADIESSMESMRQDEQKIQNYAETFGVLQEIEEIKVEFDDAYLEVTEILDKYIQLRNSYAMRIAQLKKSFDVELSRSNPDTRRLREYTTQMRQKAIELRQAIINRNLTANPGFYGETDKSGSLSEKTDSGGENSQGNESKSKTTAAAEGNSKTSSSDDATSKSATKEERDTESEEESTEEDEENDEEDGEDSQQTHAPAESEYDRSMRLRREAQDYRDAQEDLIMGPATAGVMGAITAGIVNTDLNDDKDTNVYLKGSIGLGLKQIPITTNTILGYENPNTGTIVHKEYSEVSSTNNMSIDAGLHFAALNDYLVCFRINPFMSYGLNAFSSGVSGEHLTYGIGGAIGLGRKVKLFAKGEYAHRSGTMTEDYAVIGIDAVGSSDYNYSTFKYGPALYISLGDRFFFLEIGGYRENISFLKDIDAAIYSLEAKVSAIILISIQYAKNYPIAGTVEYPNSYERSEEDLLIMTVSLPFKIFSSN